MKNENRPIHNGMLPSNYEGEFKDFDTMHDVVLASFSIPVTVLVKAEPVNRAVLEAAERRSALQFELAFRSWCVQVVNALKELQARYRKEQQDMAFNRLIAKDVEHTL